MISYLVWQPDPNMEYMFYIFAALWGLGDAVIQTQINGMLKDLKYMLFNEFEFGSH